MSESDLLKPNTAQIERKPVLLKLRKLKPVAKVSLAKPKREYDHIEDEVNFKDQLKPAADIPEKFVKPESTIASSRLSGDIKCEFCNRTFPTLSKAIHHKYMKHRYEGPNYFCEICGGLFPIRVALEHHKENSHKLDRETKEIPQSIDESRLKMKKAIKSECGNNLESEQTGSEAIFSCTFCVAYFLSADALEVHERQVHMYEKEMLEQIFLPPPSTKIRVNHNSEVYSVYYCYLCGLEYVLKFNLKKHIQTHHKVEDRTPPKDGLIRCTLCEGIFYTKKAYDAHMAHHNPDDLYVISEEHRKKVVNRVDQDFDYRRVPSIHALNESKRRRIESQSISESKKNEKVKNENSMSPPSSASDSSDEECCTKEENDETK